MQDRATGRSRGFAFVEMGSQAEADAAVSQYHGKEFQGRALTVNEARPREERPPAAAAAVMVVVVAVAVAIVVAVAAAVAVIAIVVNRQSFCSTTVLRERWFFIGQICRD